MYFSFDFYIMISINIFVIGVFDMIVTATEFKTNIGKYLALVDTEDIIITKNGKSVAKLVNIKGSRSSSLTDSLRGIMKGANVTPESIREERLAKYFENND